jgi:hypothetical protein
MMFTCPVCYYDQLEEPPCDYNICVCCGTEFGYDDDDATHEELRERWIRNGAHWFFQNPPTFWNPYAQLLRANVATVPYELGAIAAAEKPKSSKTVLEEDWRAEKRCLPYAA